MVHRGVAMNRCQANVDCLDPPKAWFCYLEDDYGPLEVQGVCAEHISAMTEPNLLAMSKEEAEEWLIEKTL